jgi:nucleoside-diphosphate-sugar epimerase
VKVLVSGATGFLGGKTIELILKEGHEVVALVRSTSNTEGLPKNIEVRKADLFDEASLENAVKDVDAVIHFAAYFDFYPRDEKLMFKCSTTETMGPIRFPPGTEDTELIPSFSYGESKIQAENAIREISKDTDLPHIILRPTGVMGEGDLYVMLEVAEQLNEGKVFALPTDLSGQIMYTHVDDIVAGFVAALTPMSALNNTFILCPDESISWEEFVEVITTHLGVKPPRLRVPAIFAKFGMVLLSPIKNRKKNSFFWHSRSVDMMMVERVYSNDKAKRLLGWTQQVTMVECFQRAIDWYFENGYLKKRS